MTSSSMRDYRGEDKCERRTRGNGGGGVEGIERQGCKKVREKCERGRQGLRGKLMEGERATSARLNRASGSGGPVGVTAVEIHGH